jgi:hypothetical protein
MLIFLLLCINLGTVLTNFNEINRLRRQSPFSDGIQPSSNKYEPRRILPENAYRKAESYVVLFWK